ncbi:unnamed protein product [Ixodes hexagonus]
MGIVDDGDGIRTRFKEVCVSLNMNPAACEQALRTYESIGMNYTLEGRKLHWIACALYVECRNGNTQTVGHTSYVAGNCVSLTRLLSTCDISLLDFFTKMKKWADMTNLNDHMRRRVETIEKSFCVTAKIYEKYTAIFSAIFKEPSQDAPKQVSTGYKRRTNKLPLCTSNDMFSFLWTLYVYIKGRFSQISSDLVNCYHLMLCCIDYGYCTALSAKRTDLLNSAFYAAQLQKARGDNNEDMGIIRELVMNHDGSYEDASVLRAHHFKHPIGRLMTENVLHGDVKTLTLSLEPSAFNNSVRKLNKTYEERFLEEGELDERIFFADDAHERIGMPRHSFGSMQRRRANAHGAVGELIGASQPRTPLTGRGNLHNREAINRSPVSTATLCAAKLQTLLAERKNAPSKELLALFGEFEPTLETSITDTVREMGDIFVKAYAQPATEQRRAAAHTDFARKRLQLGETLFYKVLEGIISIEKKQQRSNADLSAHLCHSVFQQSLFACCLEIVMFCYNSQREFPWILEIFDLVPYNFYKIIEPLIRAEEGLWREVVKHLNRTEEQILECFAWKEESPLWEAIDHSAQSVPTCREVLLPRQIATCQESKPSDATLPHLQVKRAKLTATKDDALPPGSLTQRLPTITRRSLFAPNEAKTGSDDSSNPPNTSAATIQRKASNTVLVSFSYIAGTAKSESRVVLKKDLMKNSDASQPVATPVTEVNTPITEVTTSITEVATPITEVATPVTEVATPVTEVANSVTGVATPITKAAMSVAEARAPEANPAASAPEMAENIRPVRSGSLALFFRKVYHLSAVRLQDLCDRLDILDVDVCRKIWTCFEHSLVNHTDLMKERHLDQLILCAVYIVTKVVRVDKCFQQILHCYRQQPQTRSHVYRSVLLRKNRCSGGDRNSSSNSSSPSPVEDGEAQKQTRSSSTLALLPPDGPLPTPTRLAGTATRFEFDERGDIIKFYNEVYRKKMTSFATKFSPGAEQDGSMSLTPLPRFKPLLHSPRRRVSDHHDVYVSSLEAGCYQLSPKHHTYHFNCGPGRDLREINRMVQGGDNASKRILQEQVSDDDAPQAKRYLFDKIEAVMRERRDICNGLNA